MLLVPSFTQQFHTTIYVRLQQDLVLFWDDMMLDRGGYDRENDLRPRLGSPLLRYVETFLCWLSKREPPQAPKQLACWSSIIRVSACMHEEEEAGLYIQHVMQG